MVKRNSNIWEPLGAPRNIALKVVTKAKSKAKPTAEEEAEALPQVSQEVGAYCLLLLWHLTYASVAFVDTCLFLQGSEAITVSDDNDDAKSAISDGLSHFDQEAEGQHTQTSTAKKPAKKPA